MLLVWLFGLSAGVANACIVTAVPPGDTAVAAHPDDWRDDAKDGHAQANCLDFCDKASSWARGLQSALDNIGFTTLSAPAAVHLLQVPEPSPARWPCDSPDRPGGASITIAFLRLAL